MVFAECSNRILSDINGSLYRVSGDEFVYLYHGSESANIHMRLTKMNISEFSNIKFKGVSIGRADYPKDGGSVSQLLYTADKNMYKKKISDNNGPTN